MSSRASLRAEIVVVIDDIESNDTVTTLKQRLDDMEPYEPGIACDQNFHLQPPVALGLVQHAFDIKYHSVGLYRTGEPVRAPCR